VNLWAGQAYPLTTTAPAADLVRDLWEQAQAALSRAASHVLRPQPGASDEQGSRGCAPLPHLRYNGLQHFGQAAPLLAVATGTAYALAFLALPVILTRRRDIL
jgi:hypothetical protein